jgi:hypothetical protein
MPPHAEWYAGRAAIRQFFERFLVADPKRFRLVLFPLFGLPERLPDERPEAIH